MSVGSGGILEQGQKALDPPVNCAAIDDEAPFGEPLDDVGITEAITDVPAHGQGDYIIGEAVVGESTG